MTIMTDLILTSYLEDNQLKVKIVKDSKELWLNLIEKFKKQYGPNTKQTTIDKWEQEYKGGLGERVLEHTTYWLLRNNENLTDEQAKQRLEDFDLHQRIKLIEHLF